MSSEPVKVSSPHKALSLSTVNNMIEKAFNYAKKKGFKPLCVVVLDAGGHVKACQKQDGCLGISRFEIAKGKAYGALSCGNSSRWLNEQAATRPHFLEGLSNTTGGKIISVPGGLLIKYGEEIIGELYLYRFSCKTLAIFLRNKTKNTTK